MRNNRVYAIWRRIDDIADMWGKRHVVDGMEEHECGEYLSALVVIAKFTRGGKVLCLV